MEKSGGICYLDGGYHVISNVTSGPCLFVASSYS